MTDMTDRERAFENKFQHDEEMKFRIQVQGVKQFGLWAAAHMGMTGDAAIAYANALIDEDFKEPGTQDVVSKVCADFAAKGQDKSESFLDIQLGYFIAEARKSA